MYCYNNMHNLSKKRNYRWAGDLIQTKEIYKMLLLSRSLLQVLMLFLARQQGCYKSTRLLMSAASSSWYRLSSSPVLPLQLNGSQCVMQENQLN
jgi:hypothetical protein